MKLPILSLFILMAVFANAQPRYANGTLNVNSWKVQFNTSGIHGCDAENRTATYFQGDSLFSPISGFGLWLGGTYKGNIHNIVSANNLYGTDYSHGPLRTDKPIKVHDTSRLSYWNQVFDINRKDVMLQLLDSATSESIKKWPGTGNSAYREPRIVAPFEDLNGNEKYEPNRGEYPKMVGDEMLLIVANDDVIKRQSASAVMGMGVETRAFAFHCADDSLLNHTFFVEYEITNQSTRQYDSVYLSQYVDFNVGTAGNDVLGSIKDVGVFGFDGRSLIKGGKFNQPIASVQPLDTFPCGVSLFSKAPQVNGNPRANPVHLYTFTKPVSEWGFTPQVPDSVKLLKSPFRFSGNPFSDTAYNMKNYISDTDTSDYYSIVSTGPFTINPGGVHKTTWAFTMHMPEKENADATYEKLLQEMKSIREAYRITSIENPCTSILDLEFSEEEKKPAPYIYMYPNPARDMVIINANYPVVSTQIMSLKGQVVLSSHSSKTEFNVGHFTPGLYLAKVKTEEGASAFKLRVE